MTTANAPSLVLSPDRREINSQGESYRYLLIEVGAPPMPTRSRPRIPLNLSVVLDASGSMQGARLASAKLAIRQLVERLRAVDIVSLVSFADEAVIHADALRIGISKSQLLHDLAGIGTRGCTNLFDGWKQGSLCAASVMEHALGRHNRVLLLSDGHANRGPFDPNTLRQHAEQLRDRGLFTSTVGVGHGYSPVQIQALAHAGGGRMHDTDTGEDLIDVLMGELDDLNETVIHNAVIELDLPPRTRGFVYGVGEETAVGGTLRIYLGDLLSGSTRRVVVQIKTPGGPVGSDLPLKARVVWSEPDRAYRRRVGAEESCALKYTNDTEALLSNRRDDMVASVVAEIWQAWIVRRATALNSEGSCADADQFIKGQLGWFARYVEGLPSGLKLVAELDGFSDDVRFALDVGRSKGLLSGAWHSLHGSSDKRRSKRGSNWKSDLKSH
jgi:Ca-activated chloride channel homolog